MAVTFSAEEVFTRMRSSIGILIDNTDRTARKVGAFVRMEGRGFFVTTCHDIPENIENVTIYHSTGDYSVVTPEGMIAEKVASIGLRIFSCRGEINPDLTYFNLLPEHLDPLAPGKEVFFAGWPLSLHDLAFHRGSISGLKDLDGIRTYTIDGTVVQGFSGGPVVIEHGGDLFLAAIIKSQLVASTESVLETIEDANLRALMEQIFKIAQRNRSIGIGRAISARHCRELVNFGEPARSLLEMLASDAGETVEEYVGNSAGGVKQRLVTDILKNQGYANGGGAKHDKWSKEGNSVIVPRGVHINKNTAIGIIKDMAAQQNLDDDATKVLLAEIR